GRPERRARERARRAGQGGGGVVPRAARGPGHAAPVPHRLAAGPGGPRRHPGAVGPQRRRPGRGCARRCPAARGARDRGVRHRRLVAAVDGGRYGHPEGADLVTEPALRAIDATKAYADLVALAPLSLEIAAGQMVALVGHNGSGKSTFLRLAAGLLELSDGEI